MRESTLLHELVRVSAWRAPSQAALTYGTQTLSYRELDQGVEAFASGLMHLGVGRGDRVGIYLEKRMETVVASFGSAAAGAVFVPLNPLLKPEQVRFIVQDCDVRVLVTSPERLAPLASSLKDCPSLRHVVLTAGNEPVPLSPRLVPLSWNEFLARAPRAGHRVIDIDMAAILYTSGSTGHPKGVVLSHRNLVAGAKSVASYLDNHSDDTLLAALPLSFDAGFTSTHHGLPCRERASFCSTT
jgi:long-subunit acyl-CoA synthetase (AMP-forming)